MSNKFSALVDLVVNLHDEGAIHKKRGFSLHDVSVVDISNHLLEETVELQAEVMHGTHKEQLDEAADTLAVYLHLLVASGLPPDDVIDRCISKLNHNFTLDKSEVLTDTPGITRKSRGSQ